MSVNIRKATVEDLPAIRNLVKELAIYERAEIELTASIEEYISSFNSGWFESQVAENEEGIIGMILYYETFSTWKGKMLYLEDFYVKPKFRGQNIGQQLFVTFLKTARHKGCKLTKWQVLDWNDPAVKFYEKNKATIEKEWWNGKIIFDQTN